MKSRLSALGFGLLALVAVFSATPLYAADRTTAGEFITEPPTLLSLGFEWRIDGDDNRNAQVAVSYRKAGEQTWKAGPALLRIGNERINENALQYVTPNGFAGSIDVFVKVAAPGPDPRSTSPRILISVCVRDQPPLMRA